MWGGSCSINKAMHALHITNAKMINNQRTPFLFRSQRKRSGLLLPTSYTLLQKTPNQYLEHP
ncbi:MAG: hypothetical protein ACI97X_002059, partial [Oceanospirillaceae bacterium]